MNSSIFLKLTSITAILFLSSTIYLSIFWGSFSLNIFEFLSINQIILTGIGPVLEKTLIVLFSWGIFILLFDKVFPSGGYEKRKDEGTLTNGLIRERLVVGVFAFVLYPIIIVSYYFINLTGFYRILPSSIALYSFVFSNYLVRKGVLEPESIDVRLTPILIFILISSFTVAKLNVMEIKKNTRFDYVSTESGYKKFAGKAGDYFFLLSFDNLETHILSKDKLKEIHLFKYDGNLKTKSDSIIYKLTTKNKATPQQTI